MGQGFVCKTALRAPVMLAAVLAVRNGASRGVIRSVRRLSQMTMTARFTAGLLLVTEYTSAATTCSEQPQTLGDHAPGALRGMV
jgi:hypothetical protein